MSININVHGNTNILSDYEQCRRDEIKRRKLLRLAQVREQSKTMAATARRKYDDEQNRQIAIIDRIKADEIRAWKAKHGLHSPLPRTTPSQSGTMHTGTTTRIGAAHAAAERERAEEQDPESRRQLEQQRRVAEQRGRQALAKLEGERQQRQQAILLKPAAAAAVRMRYTKPVLTKSKKVQTKESVAKHASTQVGDSIMIVPAGIETTSSLDEDAVRTSTRKTAAVEQIDISSDTLSSSVEIEAQVQQPSKPQPAMNAMHTNINHPIVGPPPPVSDSPIRQASDLIRRRRSQQIQQSVDWFAPTDPIAVRSEPLRVPDTAWSAGLRTMPTQSTTPAPAIHPTAPVQNAVESLRQRNASPGRVMNVAATTASPAKPVARRAPIRRQSMPQPNKPAAPAATSAKYPQRKLNGPAASSVRQLQSKPKSAAVPIAKQPFVPLFNKPAVADILLPQSQATGNVSQNALPTAATVQSAVAFTVSSSDEHPPSRVQYYDHANRFSKEYVANVDAVHVDDTDAVMPNAMQAAAEEVQRNAMLTAELAEKRHATELRGQRALERERTRRDYETMSAQLEQFTKQPEFDRVFGQPGSGANYTEDRLQQMADQREMQINRMFEMPAKPAPVAVITCPRVDNDKSPTSSSSSGINVASDAAYPVTRSAPDAPETDSSVLLLDYVNRRSADMETSVRHASQDLTNEKTAKLKSLLERINVQREQLLKELQQPVKSAKPVDTSTSTANALKKSQATIFQSVQTIEREKRKLLGGSKKNIAAMDKENIAVDDKLSQERANIQQRQKDVSEKERRVEQKLRKLFAEEQRREQAKEKLTNTKTQTDNTTYHRDAKKADKTTGNDGAPVQIIIQVNGGKKFDKHIRPNKQTTTTAPQKMQSSPQAHKSAASTVPLVDKPKLAYPKTPVKNMPAGSNGYTDSSTSTTYNSLPKRIQTEFSKALNGASTMPANKPVEKPTNPPPLQQTILGQYITRLLGMSRASFDKLPIVEISDMETSSSSEVNVEVEVDKLQRFISDNRSFISEVEESMHEYHLGADEEENMKSIETLWMKTLAKQETQMQRLRDEGKQLKKALRDKEHEVELVRRSETVAPIKPILKKPVSPKKVLLVATEKSIVKSKTVTAERSAPHPKPASTTATDNCNARIAELTEKIELIRREKQRLVENTFSSMGSTGSERGQNSTEYIDVHSQKQSADASQNSSRGSNIVSFADDDKVANALHETAAYLGMSKDSGINVMSRPMTASDAHSPDPKSFGRLAAEHIKEMHTIETTAHLVQQSGRRPSARPPITAARFGPIIDELDIPHELSTIVEVDTPVATSRTVIVTSAQHSTAMNNTVTTTAASDAASREQKLDELRRLLDMSATTEEKLRIRSFRQLPPLEQSNVTLGEQSTGNSTAMQIQPFLTYSRYASENASALVCNDTLLTTDVTAGTTGGRAGHAPNETADNGTANGIQIRPFQAHADYVHGVSGLCTSASIQAAVGSHGNVSNDSTDSFPDVEAELKRRNLLLRPFQTFSSSSSDDELAPPRTANEPTSVAAPPARTAALSTSSSDNLEADMNRIGLNWASSMIRKNRQAQQPLPNALSSSTSTDADRSERPVIAAASKPITTAGTGVEKPHRTPVTAATTDNQSMNSTNRGQPLNLKDFLARELLKRSTSLSTSSVHDDSTMASLFLRSLLGSSAGTNSSDPMSSARDTGQPNGGHHASERHRTSTPVRMAAGVDTASTSRRGNTDASAASASQTPNGQLFSGESGMSSVREHSTSAGSLTKK